MPALIQSESTMQESESTWQNSLGILPNHLPQSSLGKRQREHGDDGRLTGNGMSQGFHAGMMMMGQENVGQGLNGFEVVQRGTHQEGRMDLRMGMKRLKSNTDRPSFVPSSYPSTPFSSNPPPLLRTTSSFTSSSTTTTHITSHPPLPNPFFLTSTQTSPVAQEGSSSFLPPSHHPQTSSGLLFGTGDERDQGGLKGNTSDYVLATQGLRLETPFPVGIDLGRGEIRDQTLVDMDMDDQLYAPIRPCTDLPSAPPPSMFSESSITDFQPFFPEAGPSMLTPRRADHLDSVNLMQHASLGAKAVSVSPQDGNAEPYWQDGLRGIVRPGGGLDGSPLTDQHRVSSGDDGRGGRMGLMDDSVREEVGRGRDGKVGKDGMDLGRSVALALGMGMGMDSTMTHGDVEMDESPIFTSLRLPAPSPVPPIFSPDPTTDHPPVPTTPGMINIEISPAAPVNTPATTPTRQHAMPHLMMTTGCGNRSKYTMGPRADCEKCMNRVEGHVAHWR